MSGYNCGRCGRFIPYSNYVQLRWDTPTNDRCYHCGASHAVLRGEVDLISRPVGTWHDGCRPSMWHLWHTRPIEHGMYQCKFADVERALLLHWNGSYFSHDGQRVQMATFRGWRGSLV